MQTVLSFLDVHPPQSWEHTRIVEVDNQEDTEMDRNDDNCSADKRRFGESAGGQGKGSGVIAAATKAIRAVTAIVVFGVPLVAGTAALLGYGVYKTFKRLSGR
jgi:hypothetical protein